VQKERRDATSGGPLLLYTRAPVGQKKLSCFTHKAGRNVEAARTGMWDGVWWWWWAESAERVFTLSGEGEGRVVLMG